MSRRQVTNEIAVAMLAVAYKRLDDAYPDVGMGSSLSKFVSDAAESLGLGSDDFDFAKTVSLASRQLR